jgi:hypothetical protein
MEKLIWFKILFTFSLILLIDLAVANIRYRRKRIKLSSMEIGHELKVVICGKIVDVKVSHNVPSKGFFFYNIIGDQTFQTYKYYYGDSKYVSDLSK